MWPERYQAAVPLSQRDRHFRAKKRRSELLAAAAPRRGSDGRALVLSSRRVLKGRFTPQRTGNWTECGNDSPRVGALTGGGTRGASMYSHRRIRRNLQSATTENVGERLPGAGRQAGIRRSTSLRLPV